MRRFVTRGLLLLLLGGCAATTAGSGDGDRLQRWIGHPLTDLVGSWGAAAEETQENGQRVLIWPTSRFGRRTLPANLDPLASAGVAGSSEEYRCRAVVTVDSGETIVATEWRGEECYER